MPWLPREICRELTVTGILVSDMFPVCVCVCVCVLSVRALRLNYFEAQEVWDHEHIVACVSALSSHITSHICRARSSESPSTLLFLFHHILTCLTATDVIARVHPVVTSCGCLSVLLGWSISTSCWLWVKQWRAADQEWIQGLQILKGSFKGSLYRCYLTWSRPKVKWRVRVHTKTCLKVIQDTVSIN